MYRLGGDGPGGATAYLPPGVYTVSDTLELYNVGTLVLRGERMASRIVYTGPPGKPVFDLVQNFNAVQGSVERNVLPKAHRMKELGVSTLKDIPAIEPVMESPRPAELPKSD